MPLKRLLAWARRRVLRHANGLTLKVAVRRRFEALRDYHGQAVGFDAGTTAATRIWNSIQNLGEPVKPNPAEPVQPKAARKAKGGAQSAKGAPTKGKATKKATPAKNAPRGQRAANTQEATAPREGSKTAQVVTLLQRKNGATLAEIMEKMGWQKHTVRGFMAGAMKKAGYTVESFKPEGGERTYRINK